MSVSVDTSTPGVANIPNANDLSAFALRACLGNVFFVFTEHWNMCALFPPPGEREIKSTTRKTPNLGGDDIDTLYWCWQPPLSSYYKLIFTSRCVCQNLVRNIISTSFVRTEVSCGAHCISPHPFCLELSNYRKLMAISAGFLMSSRVLSLVAQNFAGSRSYNISKNGI